MVTEMLLLWKLTSSLLTIRPRALHLPPVLLIMHEPYIPPNPPPPTPGPPLIRQCHSGLVLHPGNTILETPMLDKTMGRF